MFLLSLLPLKTLLFMLIQWHVEKNNFSKTDRNLLSFPNAARTTLFFPSRFFVCTLFKKVKVKVTQKRPRRPGGGVEVKRYSFFNLGARWGGGWSTPRPGRFTPGRETQYPLYRRVGGPQGRSGRLWKISPTTEIRSPDRPARSDSLYRLSYPGHL